jgi:hypothetical protein
MKKCAYCGLDNADDASQCAGCGTDDFLVPRGQPPRPPPNHKIARDPKGIFLWIVLLGIGVYSLTVGHLILTVSRKSHSHFMAPLNAFVLLLLGAAFSIVGVFGILRSVHKQNKK